MTRNENTGIPADPSGPDERNGEPVTREAVLDYLRRSKDRFAQMYGVRRIGLFGSIVRGDAEPGSDLDILIDMPNPSYRNYRTLKFELEDHFHRPVDLVILDDVKKRIRPRIELEAVYA